jgi:hypothetical protein
MCSLRSNVDDQTNQTPARSTLAAFSPWASRRRSSADQDRAPGDPKEVGRPSRTDNVEVYGTELDSWAADYSDFHHGARGAGLRGRQIDCLRTAVVERPEVPRRQSCSPSLNSNPDHDRSWSPGSSRSPAIQSRQSTTSWQAWIRHLAPRPRHAWPARVSPACPSVARRCACPHAALSPHA